MINILSEGFFTALLDAKHICSLFLSMPINNEAINELPS